MKKLVLATAIALSTLTVQANALDDTSFLDNLIADNVSTQELKVVLTAFGVVDYYQHNCAGLTPYGKQVTMKALYDTDLYMLEASELMNTRAFTNGFSTARRFSCNDLRTELFKANARRLFR